MKYLRFLVGHFVALCLALQTPVTFAGPKGPVKFPPLANQVYHSKNMRALTERMKPYLLPEQYDFLVKKTENLPPHEMPKVTEVRPGDYEIRLGKTAVTFRTISTAQEIYSFNGKTLKLASLSLDERLNLFIKAVGMEKSGKSALWNFLMPEANAEVATTLAIIGIVIGLVGMFAQLANQNETKCEEIRKATVSCVELTGKLRIKVKETAAFFAAQTVLVNKGEGKSPEIAKQTSEACKDLGSRIGELEVIEYKGMSALKRWAICEAYDSDTLAKCLKGLKDKGPKGEPPLPEQLKTFSEKYCSPESTTADTPATPSRPPSIPAKTPATTTTTTTPPTNPEVPNIPEVLSKEPTQPTTTVLDLTKPQTEK